LSARWRRPRYVFGIDGFQALHLAMKCADMMLESMKSQLAFLGVKGDLSMPKFLPELPKRQKDRLEAFVEREALRFWTSVERAHKKRLSNETNRRGRTRSRGGRNPK
jgi:hypothetical protein